MQTSAALQAFTKPPHPLQVVTSMLSIGRIRFRTSHPNAFSDNLIQEIGFDMSYSFIFSPRPGTPAANLPDDLAMEVKKQRLVILQTRINQKAREISDDRHRTVYFSDRSSKETSATIIRTKRK